MLERDEEGSPMISVSYRDLLMIRAGFESSAIIADAVRLLDQRLDEIEQKVQEEQPKQFQFDLEIYDLDHPSYEGYGLLSDEYGIYSVFMGEQFDWKNSLGDMRDGRSDLDHDITVMELTGALPSEFLA